MKQESREGKMDAPWIDTKSKNRRTSAAQELLERHNKSPFLNRIVTCDEKWVSYKNPVNKKQRLTPGQPSVSTPKPDWRQRRILLCVWWWCGGVIHWETVPNGQTITAQYYCSQLDRVYQKIRSPGLAGHFRAGVILQQDNAKPHVANATLQKNQSARLGISYSPTL